MKNWNRIVIKVGTSTICRPDGTLNLRKIERFARIITDLKNAGKEIVMVTSGAISVGSHKIGWGNRPKDIALKQAAAAIGQCELMSIYDRYFMEYGSTTAQILLTKAITEDPVGRANVIATFNALLKTHAIPIVNENDSVATEEIVYGDNDTLSAIVACFVKADLLVILSDIDGLYDKDPAAHSDAKLIPFVKDIDAVRASAGGSHTENGTGGMVTKLHAASIAHASNIPTIIASGEDPHILYDISDGKQVGTLFLAGKETE